MSTKKKYKGCFGKVPFEHAEGMYHVSMWRVGTADRTASKLSRTEMGMCLEIHRASSSRAGEELVISGRQKRTSNCKVCQVIIETPDSSPGLTGAMGRF